MPQKFLKTKDPLSINPKTFCGLPASVTEKSRASFPGDSSFPDFVTSLPLGRAYRGINPLPKSKS